MKPYPQSVAPKPTRRQLETLRRLLDHDAWIAVYGWGSEGQVANLDAGRLDWISARTITALRQAGWIEQAELVGRSQIYKITGAGVEAAQRGRE